MAPRLWLFQDAFPHRLENQDPGSSLAAFPLVKSACNINGIKRRSSFLRGDIARPASQEKSAITVDVRLPLARLLHPCPPAPRRLLVRLKAPSVSKYSRSQPDRSLKQFRPGECPCAVDRRLGEISSGRRAASRPPRRPARPPCLLGRGYRAPRTRASSPADPPSRFSFDSPDILSAYAAAAAVALASAICRIPAWDTWGEKYQGDIPRSSFVEGDDFVGAQRQAGEGDVEGGF